MYFLFVDRESNDHNLLNSVGIVKAEFRVDEPEAPYLYAKIYMSNAYNEGKVVIPHFENQANDSRGLPGGPDESEIILFGDSCVYIEETLNFKYTGKIENDKLKQGEVKSSVLYLNGFFDDDTLIEGDFECKFAGGWQIKQGKFQNGTLEGDAVLLKISEISGSIETTIDGRWNSGVHESGKFAIAYTDKGMRSTRVALLLLTNPICITTSTIGQSLYVRNASLHSNSFNKSIFVGNFELKIRQKGEEGIKLL